MYENIRAPPPPPGRTPRYGAIIDARKDIALKNILSTLKGIYLSKAVTCMKIFLYKQELFFCQEDGYLWPHCCMNNLYISHRSLYAPAYNF